MNLLRFYFRRDLRCWMFIHLSTLVGDVVRSSRRGPARVGGGWISKASIAYFLLGTHANPLAPSVSQAAAQWGEQWGETRGDGLWNDANDARPQQVQYIGGLLPTGYQRKALRTRDVRIDKFEFQARGARRVG